MRLPTYSFSNVSIVYLKNHKKSFIILKKQTIKFDCFFLIFSGKLLQDSATSGLSPANPWITGGQLGTKNAVLVFKTSALIKYSDSCGDQDDQVVPTSSSESTSGLMKEKNISCKTKEKSSINKKLMSSNFDLYKKRLNISTPDSLSSSENSISSACDDPTELEADIAKAEKSEDSAERQCLADADSGNVGLYESTTSTSSTDKENVKNVGETELDEMDDISLTEMPASILKITYKFTNTETKLLRKILDTHGLKEASENQNFNLMWTGLHMKPDVLRGLTPYQRVNHFPR